MQYPRKASCISLIFLIHLHCLAIQVSSLDTLKQGDELNSSSQLVSAKGNFTLGFYSSTVNTYLAIWLTNLWSNPVWIGNREKPIPNNTSPVLTIGARGKLVIRYGGGESIELYAGGSRQNVTATLLDTGNFVVKEINSSDQGEFLWQSFDHPTDTLLPGMKLGVNHRTGRNLTLSSWLWQSDPAPGAFTLEWSPSVRSFLVRRRGVVYWTSGELKYYYDRHICNIRVEFVHFDVVNHSRLTYNFTNVTSNEEEYLIFSLVPAPNAESIRMPDKVIHGWRLDSQGDIYDTNSTIPIARPSSCYGYNTQGGCESWEQPKCRNNSQRFDLKSGDFTFVNGTPAPSVNDKNSSLCLSDCKESCWKTCQCVAFINTTTGCSYWIGKNLKFVRSLDGSAGQMFVLDSASSSKGDSTFSSKGDSVSLSKGKEKVVLIILVGTIVLLILGIVLFVMRKLKQAKREKQLHELLKLEGYTETYELENGGARNHDLKLFTYASILSATNNFSSDDRLGEGGFGPVYKGKTPEGQDIAVKLLSRQSGQGLLEFKTELILISKLQHVNLVKLLGFCIHGDEKMIIYDYMHNKSLDFFLFSPSEKEQLD